MCRWIGGSVLINNHFEGGGGKLHVTPCTPFPVLRWICLFILEGTEYLLYVLGRASSNHFIRIPRYKNKNKKMFHPYLIGVMWCRSLSW